MIAMMTDEEKLELMGMMNSSIVRKFIIERIEKDPSVVLLTSEETQGKIAGAEGVLQGVTEKAIPNALSANPAVVTSCDKKTRHLLSDTLLHHGGQEAKVLSALIYSSGGAADDPEKAAQVVSSAMLEGGDVMTMGWRDEFINSLRERLNYSMHPTEDQISAMLERFLKLKSGVELNLCIQKISKAAHRAAPESPQALLQCAEQRNFVATSRALKDIERLEVEWWKKDAKSGENSKSNSDEKEQVADVATQTEQKLRKMSMRLGNDEIDAKDVRSSSSSVRVRRASKMATQPKMPSITEGEEVKATQVQDIPTNIRTELVMKKELRRRMSRRISHLEITPKISGLTMLVSRHLGGKKNSTKHAMTLKKLHSIIAEVLQEKCASDMSDKIAGRPKQLFPNFIRDTLTLKYGKGSTRAHKQTMKQLQKIVAGCEFYYDKSSRVRAFAKAAGVSVCCVGGVCDCVGEKLWMQFSKNQDMTNLQRLAAAHLGSGTSGSSNAGARGSGQKRRRGNISTLALVTGARKAGKAGSKTGRPSRNFDQRLSKILSKAIIAIFKIEEVSSKKSPKKQSQVKKVIKATSVDEIAGLLGDGEKQKYVKASRVIAFAGTLLPNLEKERLLRFDNRIQSLKPGKIDGQGVVWIGADTALEEILNFFVDEENRIHLEQMRVSARKIERLWRDNKARKNVQFLKENLRLVRERKLLEALYDKHDKGEDGCKSCEELEEMLREIDPSLTSREVLESFNEAIELSLERDGDSDDSDTDSDSDSDKDSDGGDKAGNKIPALLELDPSGGAEDFIDKNMWVELVWRLGYHIDPELSGEQDHEVVWSKEDDD